jgi:hypothetical protein
VNLKAFVDAAAKRDSGETKASQVLGVWFGNQVWEGSRGGTLVTALDLVVDGHRLSSTPSR